MEPVARPKVIRFGVFEVSPDSGELFKNGHKVHLEAQPFRVLSILLEKSGEVVIRHKLQHRLWPQDTFVDFEHSLNVDIQRLRHALGDSADNPRYIETLPRRGYRFICPIDSFPQDSFRPSQPPSAEGLNLSDVPRLGNGVEKPVEQERGQYYQGTREVASERWDSWRPWKMLFPGILGLLISALFVAWWSWCRPSYVLELKQHRLTSNSSENPISWGSISPDGKYLAYPDTIGIHLKLLATQEDKLISRPAGVAPDAGWQHVAWFPDGTRLLATLSEAGDRPSVWTVSILGGNMCRLRDDAIGMSVSADGNHLAYTTGSGQNHYREIWIMDSQGEALERVLSLDENDFALRVEWCPDGRRLAYWKQHPDLKRVENSIETCDLKGTKRTLLLTDPRLASFCWIPQGYILYSRFESLITFAVDSNLWKVPVDLHTGRLAGNPIRLTSWTGFEIRCLSASADGKRIAFNKRSYEAQVYVGELEAGGTRIEPPKRLTLDEAADYPCAWMEDGNAVVFHSARRGSAGLYKQEIDKATAQTLAAGEDIVGDVRLSPEGSWLLYLVGNEEIGSSTPLRVMRLPVDGGLSQLVLEAKNVPGLIIRCSRTPATFCAIGEMSPDMRHLTITAFDPRIGRGQVLRTIETDPTAVYDWDLAPNGSKLACYKIREAEAHIRLFSLIDGKDRVISVKGWGGLESMDWSVDGRVFYCGSVSPEGVKLLSIDMDGNAKILWQKKGAIHAHGVPSPDGRCLAVMTWVVNSNHWMVEGFKF